MRMIKSLIVPTLIPTVALALLFALNAGGYVVIPADIMGTAASPASKGWSAVTTGVETSGSDLKINLAIRNETADWSAMQAIPKKPAVLTVDGKTSNCETVFFGTGGHRLAPGFQMRGYIAGKKSAPTTQLMYVECKGAKSAPGAKLSIEYSYVTGQYNYYEKEAGKVTTRLEVDLDKVATDLTYPVAAPVEGLVQPATTKLIGLNDVELTLTDVTRTDKGLKFKWGTNNPGAYPSYVHIGNPPVIGTDGILYGFYQSPDIASVPLTPAGKTAEWETEVVVPNDVKGYYIMLSVETGKQRLFQNYAIDITEQ